MAVRSLAKDQRSCRIQVVRNTGIDADEVAEDDSKSQAMQVPVESIGSQPPRYLPRRRCLDSFPPTAQGGDAIGMCRAPSQPHAGKRHHIVGDTSIYTDRYPINTPLFGDPPPMIAGGEPPIAVVDRSETGASELAEYQLRDHGGDVLKLQAL